ncbi:hypothetical protein B0H15DRAFT_563259 [Mycena belliarum]|uniref:F-box domain-containing protein n=1 Tax=Mycena belliarum TaxID=1033014 RepID=A0AAD6XIR3_9AGAR|nr:hypothetical protein B0H15DRAFT_563259 [Mycena belliae]
MSAEQIQRRIDKLSADAAEVSAEIEAGKKRLKQITLDKCAARAQLNAVRDPMARLPLEISSEIFMHGLSSCPQPRAWHPPMLFLNVCNMWSSIALSMPPLWSAFHADRPVKDLSSLLDMFINRAGNRPMYISLPQDPPQEAVTIIKLHAARLKALKLHQCDLNLFIAAGPFLFLETLVILGSTKYCHEARKVPIVRMLARCPNLAECILEGVSESIGIAIEEQPPLPHLKHIEFGKRGPFESPWASDLTSDYALRVLSLPRLRTLLLHFRDIGLRDFRDFLRRSSPPLQKICWDCGLLLSRGTFEDLEDCLALLPKLTHLELFRLTPHAGEQFVAALARADLVPNLSSITFEGWTAFSKPWYEKLAGVLLARRNEINIVRVVWNYQHRRERLADDICATLQELVADGMWIHVGSPRRNLI